MQQELFNQSYEAKIMPLVIYGLENGRTYTCTHIQYTYTHIQYTYTRIHIHIKVISRNQVQADWLLCIWFKINNSEF